MIFDELVGNDSVKKRLGKMLESGQVPHLMLFSGPESAQKRLFATAFAREWLRQISTLFSPQGTLENLFHPDLQILRPEGKTGMLSIQSVRQVIETIYLSPYEAGGKAIIIDDAERMLPTSANALLKVLEEPPRKTIIILVSSRPEKLLGTIRSRSQLIRFQPGKETVAAQEQEDVLEELLFTLLMNAKDKNFADLASACQEIQKAVETRCKSKEAALKEDFAKVIKDMPASAKDALENDIEGAIALFRLHDIEKLLGIIYAFYRDLAAIGANHSTLLLPHKKEMLVQAYNQGRGISLDRVDRQLQWAKQAVERYQPLQNVLETVFLQLF